MNLARFYGAPLIILILYGFLMCYLDDKKQECLVTSGLYIRSILWFECDHLKP